MDYSIPGDELEHHRIQLEHNLQNTELSFHMSSDASVEYPRHLSEPSAQDFPSFVHRPDEDGNLHAWSYRTVDDEDGVNPYGGETMSTAAHHASVVTLSAGLGGGRTARSRDRSLSGAEYDPDRPLQAMIAGVNSKHSMFDIDPKPQETYDPVVVDSTAELDRLLESGHAPAPSMRSHRSVRLASPMSSASSDSESAVHRPKLADHLRHVSFSPKRPRSAQGFNPTSPLARSTRQPADESMNLPTPRPTRKSNFAPTPAKPEVRLQPATPSTTGSKFTKMAKGINKEIEATKQRAAANHAGSSNRRRQDEEERNPFLHEEPEPVQARKPTPRKSSLRDTSAARSRVYLPDVTGLTNAVESPMRHGAQYYPYKADTRPRDTEARLVQTLTAVQSQLQDLEDENGISRRRVQELEMELEECKREVARERTRLIDRENSLRAVDVSAGYHRAGANGKAKGKSKAKDVSTAGFGELDDERLRFRYKEAVDEKKALEALVNSLRSHLTRLTAELSSHQELLAELRDLREQDARALREKSNEIIQLKDEVQRLAGEVEVLRGVVEEGLKERRASRESISVDRDEEEGSRYRDDLEESRPGPDEDEQDANVTQDDDTEEEQDTLDLEPAFAPDRTMRTDRATLGESTNSKAAQAADPRFMGGDDIGRIAAEVEERRSNRSHESIASRVSRSPSPIRRSKHQNHRRATVEDVEDDDEMPATSNARASTSRPAAPTPGHAAIMYDRATPREREADLEMPFPVIRGEQLEKLFFSAPEHNAKTCTVCYRGKHRLHERDTEPSWSRPHVKVASTRQAVQQDDDDEGYGGSEGVDDDERGRARAGKGKQREQVAFSEDPAHWRQIGKKHGLPPQTVVARVIRELEDDFTHYKSVYVELADQYKIMDAVSDVPRRNMLARHLREVIDILEQKGDQIASLYNMLSFKDKYPSEPNRL